MSIYFLLAAAIILGGALILAHLGGPTIGIVSFAVGIVLFHSLTRGPGI